MEGKKLAVFLLLVVVLDLLLFSHVEAKPFFWRRRRRRRRRSVPPCSSATPSGYAWANSWHQDFSRQCRNSYSLSYWYSYQRKCKSDRIHYFRCRYAPVSYGEGNCAWTYYRNDYDKTLTFQCPHNGFITGVRSVYSGSYKDRRFAFRCCHVPGYFHHTCQHTQYQNSLAQAVSYSVPYGCYLVGVYSYHSNSYQDRVWRFEVCQFKKMSSGK